MAQEETVFEPMEDEAFSFACHPDVPCFNRCCQDLKLYLTPYDILRLTGHLGISSQELIDGYTWQENEGTNGYPRLLVTMREDTKQCIFLRPEGCSVYPDRPSSCRMYPLGRATRQGKSRHQEVEEWFFMVKEDHCRGFEESKEWTIQEWMKNQGVVEYNKHNDRWMEVIVRKPLTSGHGDLEKKLRMFYLASYQLDDFARFVFESGFLDRFDFSARELENFRNSREHLYGLAIRWLKFCLFGDRTLTMRRS